MKFRKKPVIIEAVQWNGGDFEFLNDFCGRNWTRADAVDEQGPDDKENVVVYNTAEKQWLNLPLGYWLIRGVQGELYPCKPDIFDQTYELVTLPTSK